MTRIIGLLLLNSALLCSARAQGTGADQAYAEASASIAQRDFGQAELQLRDMKARYPQDMRWGAPLLMVMEERGKIQDGLRLAREIASQYANSAEYHLAVGRLLVKADDPVQSQVEFDEALRATSDPGMQLTIYSTKGETYILALEWQQAIAAFRKWKEIAGLPSFGLAQALGESGDLDAAIAEYRQVMQVTPNDAMLWNNLAYVLAERSTDLQEALGLALQSWSVNQASAAVTDTLGWVYYKLGRYSDAEQKLIEAMGKEGGNHPSVREHLAQTMDGRGEWTEQRRELRGLLRQEMSLEETRRMKELLDAMQKQGVQ